MHTWLKYILKHFPLHAAVKQIKKNYFASDEWEIKKSYSTGPIKRPSWAILSFCYLLSSTTAASGVTQKLLATSGEQYLNMNGQQI